jgi:hypothetical protein
MCLFLPPVLPSFVPSSSPACKSAPQYVTLNAPMQDANQDFLICPVASATTATEAVKPLLPIKRIDFTFPALSGTHPSRNNLSWLLHILNNTQLMFLISIPCSSEDFYISALDSAASPFCSTLGWIFICCTINTAVIGDLASLIFWLFIAHCSTNAPSLNPSLAPVHADPLCAGYGTLVISACNHRDESLLALHADSFCDPSVQSTMLPHHHLWSLYCPACPILLCLTQLRLVRHPTSSMQLCPAC